MKLDELKKMISEEFESYMREDEDQVDVSVGADDVDMDADMDMGEEGEDSPEETLRAIFDQLKAFFEPEGEEMGDEMGDEMGMDDMGGEAPELEENSSTEASTQKTGMKPFGKSSAGANVGYGAVGGKGSTGYDAGSKALQERFQKLANIKTLKG
jgi:hypothetical protein